MNSKKLTAALLCICILFGLNVPAVYAQDDNGKIDLYEAFSSKEDKMKTEVGSRIYKWSMHLPDDGVIYKSEQVNFFNMSTSSYQASIQLEVNKNKDDLSLEELLYKMQNKQREFFSPYDDDKEYVVDISKDGSGQKYIHIIKSNQMYDYFMINEVAQEFSDYIENRIYISNGYIYNLTVNMKGQFYRQHEEMFNKLVSSFKLSFDEKNPYIKELSDSVSSTREYKNTSYGWKMMMSPYWRVKGAPNARTQYFSPVYSDEELNGNKDTNNKEEFKVQEGISVSLISSNDGGETAGKWAEKEIAILKNYYNSEVYEILSNEAKTQGGMNVQHVIVRYKTVTNNPFIVHYLYAVGNGYKYLVSATMKEEKYRDANKRNEFENMLNSFTLDRTNLSKYLGKIVSAKSIINLNEPKELKMKKYDFGTKLSKSWSTSSNGYDFDFDTNDYSRSYYELYGPGFREDVSNNEYVAALEPTSNIRIDMNAGLNTRDINEIVKERAKNLLKNDEVCIGLSKVKIQSAECEDIQLYYIENEYDLNAIKKFVSEDKTKIYDLEKLRNQYEYIVKKGKDIYTLSITLPVANMTASNKLTILDIWNNTTISKKNYSKQDMVWKIHVLDEFNEETTKNQLN